MEHLAILILLQSLMQLGLSMSVTECLEDGGVALTKFICMPVDYNKHLKPDNKTTVNFK